MRNITRSLALMAGIAALAAFAPNQAVAQAVKVDIADVGIEDQKTPDYSVSGVTEKKWDPKTWLEFEVIFKTEIARSKATAIDGLLVKFYLFLDASKEETRTFTGETKLVAVPAGEKSATVAYISPSSIEKITGSKNGGKNKVKFWGIEFLYGGEIVGKKSSTGKDWWKSPKAPATASGVLKKKSETPFAPLWGDFHATEAGK